MIARTPAAPIQTHVNSAKWCQNKPNKKQANKVLFENCRRFIRGELRVLSPDIVVTQGGWAKVAIQENYDVQEHEERSLSVPGYKKHAHYETGRIELEPGATSGSSTPSSNIAGRCTQKRSADSGDEHAVKPPQDSQGQDHVLVLPALEAVANEVHDLPNEADQSKKISPNHCTG